MPSENQQEYSPFMIPQSLSRTVARYLEKEIIEGSLEPGFRIVPEELARRFNVSKSPVREALFSLEKEGLVTSRPRIGFFVTEIKLGDIEEIYPIRASLNALMLKTMAEREYKPDFIPSIERLLREMEVKVQHNDISGYFYLNVQLYDFIMERCPNNRLRMMLNQLGKQVLRFRFMTMSQPGHIRVSMERHKSLLKALMHRDAASITEIAENVVYGALEVLREALAK